MSKVFSSIRERLKNTLAWVLYHTGFLNWRLQTELRNRIVVLMYHRVLPEDKRAQSFSHPAIIVDPGRFAMQLDTLARYFDIITLPQLHKTLNNPDQNNSPRIVITFDDAWHDNYLYAYQELRQRGLPATIFVPVNYIGSGKLFWQEELGHLIQAACRKEKAAPILEKYGWLHLAHLPDGTRNHFIRVAVRNIKHLDEASLNKIMGEFRAYADQLDFGPDAYLTVAQMQEMASNGIEFQSHACTHRLLSRLDESTIAKELIDSRHWLGQNIGTMPIAIAYPNGDYDDRVQAAAQQAGYALGFSTRAGAVEPGDPHYTLRRVNIHDDSSTSPERFLMSIYLACRHGRKH